MNRLSMTNSFRALTMACHYTEGETTCWFSSRKLTSVPISKAISKARLKETTSRSTWITSLI